MCRLLLILACICLSVCAQAADPTMPPWHRASASAGVSPAPLRLEAIIEREQRALAVINGTALAVGQKIRGYTLVGISGERVRLRGKQGTRELRLARSIIDHSNVTNVKPSHRGHKP